ncbi:MAG: hypothetical protein ACFHWX_05925 [Bacteroidota bacterium]
MKYLIIIAFSIINLQVIAQGCSDAGFCTMGAMKPDQNYSKAIDLKLRSIELSYYHATTTLSPVIQSYTADVTIGVNDYNFFQVKVPYMMTKGNFGKTQGLSDISLSWTRQLVTKEGYTISATLGGKIPSNKSDLDREPDGAFGGTGDFPMYQQVSLGSYDLVAGGAFITDEWLLATGVQVALTENNNDFRWGQWPDYPSQEYVRKYALANNLKRGIDVMLRVERNFRFTNFNFNVGLLPIYRITKDERYDFNIDQRVKVDGTTGLALSALVGGGYRFNVNNGIRVLFGRKITQKDVNPDGLTRHAIQTISYIYRF